MRTTNGEEEKKTQAHQITVKSLDSLSFRSFMDMNQHSWGIKDLESRFVYMNQVALDVCNIPAGFNVEGRLDSDCPADWAEFAPEFQKQDRETEKNKKTVAVISTQYYGKEKSLNPYLFDKSPLYNEANECIGTIWCGRKLNFLSLSQYFGQLVPSILTLDPPMGSEFTEKELEIIFFSLQPLSSKEIARKLALSYRTVENRRLEIYRKMDVHSRCQFREYCCAHGFDKYIPPRFIQRGVTFI